MTDGGAGGAEAEACFPGCGPAPVFTLVSAAELLAAEPLSRAALGMGSQTTDSFTCFVWPLPSSPASPSAPDVAAVGGAGQAGRGAFPGQRARPSSVCWVTWARW